MSAERVVADLTGRSLEDAKAFYGRVLGLEPVMDHGWIVTLADPNRPGAQIGLATADENTSVVPNVSVHVDDGVRRFFVRDPDGHVINVLGHR